MISFLGFELIAPWKRWKMLSFHIFFRATVAFLAPLHAFFSTAAGMLKAMAAGRVMV